MSVGFLVVYTGEETIRCWLQTKVEERQLHIRNDPGEIEAGMKTVDVGCKIFYLLSTSGGGTSNVVDISFLQGWFCSRVLIEDLFLDMPHEETHEEQKPALYKRYFDDNPADDASRGLNPQKLSSQYRWWRGPDFLWETEDCWPSAKYVEVPDR